jgi:uncharacterized membrane protein YhaH (DUF805 family)
MSETGLTVNERMELDRLGKELRAERRQAEFDEARRKVERRQEFWESVLSMAGGIAILLAGIGLFRWAVWSVERAVDESWQQFPIDMGIGFVAGGVLGVILSIAGCWWQRWHQTGNAWQILGVVIPKVSVLQSAPTIAIWLMLMVANQANGAPWAPYETSFGICAGLLEASLLLMMEQTLVLTLIPNEEKLYHKNLSANHH